MGSVGSSRPEGRSIKSAAEEAPDVVAPEGNLDNLLTRLQNVRSVMEEMEDTLRVLTMKLGAPIPPTEDTKSTAVIGPDNVISVSWELRNRVLDLNNRLHTLTYR